MDTKPLLFGLIGFFIGGFIVSVAATTFDKPATDHLASSEILSKKTGDDYDKAFIDEMIKHHEGAVAMAKLSANNAKHDEVRQLSQEIISAQEKEITQMKQWQMMWGYPTQDHTESNSSH